MKYFLTIGTQPHQFSRIIDYALSCIEENEIVMQIGKTKYDTSVTNFDFTQDFDKYLDECEVVITHGGVGSIIGALLKGKKVIAVARKAEFNEHVDDHQLEIVNKLAKQNYILMADNLKDFQSCIKAIDTHQFEVYQSNKTKFNKLLIEELNV